MRRDGSMAGRGPNFTRNLLLDALLGEERDRLLEDATTHPIELGHVYLDPGDPITRVMFPISGTLSIIAEPDERHRVEAATVGREGVANVHSALGSRVAGQQLIGQVAGEAISVEVELFAKEMSEPGRLEVLVHGYIEALFAQASLSAACNAAHHLDQRCARWLLQTHDRADADSFFLKQEFLAMMLGVQRPSVTVAAKTLQAAELITYRRGSITILDREGLEEAACGCYEQVRSEYSRLVPLKPDGPASVRHS